MKLAEYLEEIKRREIAMNNVHGETFFKAFDLYRREKTRIK